MMKTVAGGKLRMPKFPGGLMRRAAPKHQTANPPGIPGIIRRIPGALFDKKEIIRNTNRELSEISTTLFPLQLSYYLQHREYRNKGQEHPS